MSSNSPIQDSARLAAIDVQPRDRSQKLSLDKYTGCSYRLYSLLHPPAYRRLSCSTLQWGIDCKGDLFQCLCTRRAYSAVGVLTIIAMGIWSFSNPLLFYWVLLVLVLQRGPILPCQEELSKPSDDAAKNTAFAMLALPLLVLLPYPIEFLLALQQMPNPALF